MKTQGRERSKNIEDKRNYFGTPSNSQMQRNAGIQAFYMESIKGASNNRVEGTPMKRARKGRK